MTRKINLVVLHCSATASGKLIGPGSAVQAIDGWHRARKFNRANSWRTGFNSHLGHIGYHYVIDLDGKTYTGRAHGEMGAHAAGYNTESLGICLVGGAEREAKYTPAQWAALATLCEQISKATAVPLAPAQRVSRGPGTTDLMVLGFCGHRDLSPDKNGNGVADRAEWLKTCPGFDVAAWLANGRKPLAGHVL